MLAVGKRWGFAMLIPLRGIARGSSPGLRPLLPIAARGSLPDGRSAPEERSGLPVPPEEREGEGVFGTPIRGHQMIKEAGKMSKACFTNTNRAAMRYNGAY